VAGYAGPRRAGGCKAGFHCMIWYGRDGYVVIGCAHCPQVSKKMDLSVTYSEDLIAKQCAGSRAGHLKHCSRPIR